MQWLVNLIVAIVRVLLPWVVNQSRPTAGVADPDRGSRAPLGDRVRRHWMLALVCLPFLVCGCGVRTIYVPGGTPVRLRETVQDARVWVKDSDGAVVAGEMDLPEGWYCLPVTGEDQ